MITCVFRSEPQHIDYFNLLDFSLTMKGYAVLVSLSEKSLNSNGRQCLNDLKPFLYDSSIASEWPGTKLYPGYSAYVYKFKIETHFIEIIKRYSNGLYDWISPDLPEDLSFLRFDGNPWLINTVHEGDSYLNLTDEEYSKLLEMFPSLRSLLIIE